MTDLDPDAIRARYEAARLPYSAAYHVGDIHPAYNDVPALLARIAELEAVVELFDEMRNDRDQLPSPGTSGRWHGCGTATRAEADRDQFQAERDRLQARLDTATAQVEELRGQRNKWRRAAEVARADLWRLEDNFAGQEDELDEAFAKLKAHERCGLCGGVLAQWECELIAAQADQQATETALSTTQSQDQGADDGAGTEGSQAQGGAQACVEQAELSRGFYRPRQIWPRRR